MTRYVFVIFVSFVSFVSASFVPPFGPWSRLNNAQPILSPRGDGFEAAGVFNPAVIKVGDRFVMLYRAQDRQGISRIGSATSHDGVTFTRDERRCSRPKRNTKRVEASKILGSSRSTAPTTSLTPRTTARTRSLRSPPRATCAAGNAVASSFPPTASQRPQN